MAFAPLTIARRHVLGDLYSKCDEIFDVPVYLESDLGERLGFATETYGNYADSVTFHLAEDVCKKLSTGHFTYSFGYDYSEPDAAPVRGRRIKLNYICLTGRKNADGVIVK